MKNAENVLVMKIGSEWRQLTLIVGTGGPHSGIGQTIVLHYDSWWVIRFFSFLFSFFILLLGNFSN
jgi:hypothetical protein